MPTIRVGKNDFAMIRRMHSEEKRKKKKKKWKFNGNVVRNYEYLTTNLNIVKTQPTELNDHTFCLCNFNFEVELNLFDLAGQLFVIIQYM